MHNITFNSIRNLFRAILFRSLKVGILSILLLALAAPIANAQLTAVFNNRKDACDGLDNGSIDVNVTGSVGTITVQFLGPPNIMVNPTDNIPMTVSGLAPRYVPFTITNYLVIVQDDNGAVAYNVDIFNVSPDLDATLILASNNLSCATPNGSIDINVTGGTLAYSYLWTGPVGYPTPNNTQDVSNLIGGDYSVVVSDLGSNCTRTLGPFINKSYN